MVLGFTCLAMIFIDVANLQDSHQWMYRMPSCTLYFGCTLLLLIFSTKHHMTQYVKRPTSGLKQDGSLYEGLSFVTQFWPHTVLCFYTFLNDIVLHHPFISTDTGTDSFTINPCTFCSDAIGINGIMITWMVPSDHDKSLMVDIFIHVNEGMPSLLNLFPHCLEIVAVLLMTIKS